MATTIEITTTIEIIIFNSGRYFNSGCNIAFGDLILSTFVFFFQTCKHAVCDLLTCEIRPISEQVTLTVAFHLLINPRTWIDLQVGQHLYTSLCIYFSIIYLANIFFFFFLFEAREFEDRLFIFPLLQEQIRYSRRRPILCKGTRSFYSSSNLFLFSNIERIV